MTSLLTFDPGGTTGWSVWQVYPFEPIALQECGQTASGLAGFIYSWGERLCDYDLVVSESFVLDGRTVYPDVTPLRIEGALLALRGSRPVVFQRNTYKSHAPDDLLKRTALFQSGKPHANDAIRHAIAWAKTSGHRPTIERLWPAPAGV